MSLESPEAVERYLAAREQLDRAMFSDSEAGATPDDLARMTEPAWRRTPPRLSYLSSLQLYEAAETALAAADLTSVMRLRLASPVKLMMGFSPDKEPPTDTEIWSIANRIAAAMKAAGIEWSYTDIVRFLRQDLRDGGEVRLKWRTSPDPEVSAVRE
jgi:hypothetical protein